MLEKRGKFKSAFTLIELLVVVAIISILAAIAVANLLRSNVKSKVTRNLAEMKTLSVAVEAYAADHNAYPRMAHWGFYEDPAFDVIQSEEVSGVLSKALSTPVAYATEAFLLDPFMSNNELAPLDERLYTYQDLEAYVENVPSSEFWPQAREFYGSWRMAGVGPDETFSHGFANSAQLPYDPTNGTVSAGNIWYYQTGTENKLPPIPELLGEH